jgi:hypothetical protein
MMITVASWANNHPLKKQKKLLTPADEITQLANHPRSEAGLTCRGERFEVEACWAIGPEESIARSG